MIFFWKFSFVFLLQYLSDIQHLNLGFNQLECIPVPPAEDRILIFKNMTTLLLKNNNLQNLKGATYL